MYLPALHFRIGRCFVQMTLFSQSATFYNFFPNDLTDLKTMIVIGSNQKKAAIPDKCSIIPVLRHDGIVLRHDILINFSAFEVFNRKVISGNIAFTPVATGNQKA